MVDRALASVGVHPRGNEALRFRSDHAVFLGDQEPGRAVFPERAVDRDAHNGGRDGALDRGQDFLLGKRGVLCEGVGAGGGEVLASSTGMRIVEDGSHTGHRVGVMADRLPPGSGGPPQHIHRQHSETFYVLSGTMRFTSAGEHADVPAGGVVTAPIGIPHTFSNPDPAEWAAFTCTVAPDLSIGYFRELAALIAQRGSLDEVEETDILKVMARYATEPYPPPGHK